MIFYFTRMFLIERYEKEKKGKKKKSFLGLGVFYKDIEWVICCVIFL